MGHYCSFFIGFIVQRIAQRQFRQPASGQIAKFHWMIRVAKQDFLSIFRN